MSLHKQPNATRKITITDNILDLVEWGFDWTLLAVSFLLHPPKYLAKTIVSRYYPEGNGVSFFPCCRRKKDAKNDDAKQENPSRSFAPKNK